jgi:hypothetical protein
MGGGGNYFYVRRLRFFALHHELTLPPIKYGHIHADYQPPTVFGSIGFRCKSLTPLLLWHACTVQWQQKVTQQCKGRKSLQLFLGSSAPRASNAFVEASLRTNGKLEQAQSQIRTM